MSQAAPEKNIKTKNNRLLIIIVTLVIILLTLITAIFGFLFFQSKEVIAPNISKSSSANFSAESNSSSSGYGFSFPVFVDQNQSSAKSATTNSANSDNSNNSSGAAYNITLKPKFTDGLTQQTLNESKCGENIYTTNGLSKFQNGDKLMLIGHSRQAVREVGKMNLQQAKNYINRSTDFMSDGNTGFGPDYLQFLRPNCNQSNITKVKEITDSNLKYNDAVRGLITLQGNSNFPDVVINIYSQKDDHLILLAKTYKFDDFFTRAQYQSCSDSAGVPKLFCLSDLINNSNEMQTKLNGGIKELITSFEI